MYLRFTTPGVVTRARVAPGPFRVASDLWWERRDDPLGIALRHELDWFNEWLPVPSRFDVHSKSRRWRDGVCWFRDHAREMVAHAYALIALIEDCGVPTERIWTRDPGQVLYRDPFQVVAKPERRMLATRRRSPHRRRSCQSTSTTTNSPAFERSSKRRKGYPSETRVKRGLRSIKGGPDDPNSIELIEKLGRNDPCPCGSGNRFQALLPALGPVSTGPSGGITGGEGPSSRRGVFLSRRRKFIFHVQPIADSEYDDRTAAARPAAEPRQQLAHVSG